MTRSAYADLARGLVLRCDRCGARRELWGPISARMLAALAAAWAREHAHGEDTEPTPEDRP